MKEEGGGGGWSHYSIRKGAYCLYIAPCVTVCNGAKVFGGSTMIGYKSQGIQILKIVYAWASNTIIMGV